MSAATEMLKGQPADVAARILLVHREDPSWLDEFAEEIDRARAGETLQRVLQAWGLSQSEFARSVGVTRQAVGKWLDRGVPEERVESIGDLAAATDLLVRHLKRDRIVAVVRRKAPALGGSSLLDLVASGCHREVLQACRSMFEFERAQA